MAKKSNRKSQALASKSRTFEELDAEMKRLEAQKFVDIEKALFSDDPQQILNAQSYLEKQKGGKKGLDVKSWMFLPDDYAYTGKGYKETVKNITFDALKNVSKLFIVKLVHQTRIDQVKNFLNFTTDDQKEGFTIKKKRGLFDTEATELSKSEQKVVTGIVKFLESCGNNSKWDNYDDFIEFIVKILTDSLSYDQVSFENVRSRNGELQKIVAVDASMIRQLDSNDPRYVDQFKDMQWNYQGQSYVPKYCMSYQGQILRHPTTGNLIMYYPWELGYGIRNKTTDVRANGYGTSELETGIELITWILWSFQYNSNFFKQGSQPKGFINVKDGNLDNGVVNEFRNSWRQMMTGVGNCLSGNTFIVTPTGRKSLESFFTENNEDKKTEIWTGKKFENALIYKSSKKTLNKITLNNGMSIESSPEHRFKTLRQNKVVWVKCEDLRLNDYVLVNKKSVDESISDLSYKDRHIDSDLFEMLGWMIGDGHVGKNENSKRMIRLFYHPKKELNIIEKHISICLKYGINCKKYIQKTTKNQEDLLKSKGVKSIIGEYPILTIMDSDFFNYIIGLGFKTSNEGKTLPSFIYSFSKEHKLAFLRGLFSADGYISLNGEQINISISNFELKEQTRHLLLTEGIRCTSYVSKVDPSGFSGDTEDNVLIVKDRDLFLDNIGFIQEYKNKRRKNRKRSKYNVNEAPISFIRDLAIQVKTFNKTLSSDKKLSQSELKNVLNISKGHQKASLSKVLFYAKKIKYSYPEFLDNFYLETVIDINRGDEKVEMYDVEIFDNENQFIANGILTHNSHKVPVFEGIDLEWIDLQSSNRDMEFNQWVEFLLIILCSLYRIDPSELGFNFNQANQPFGQDGQKERLDHSKKKGLKPLLVFLEKIINKYVISELDENYELKFTGIDIEDEDSQVELDKKKLDGGMVSMESVFEKYMGREHKPETDTILNQVYQQAQQAKMMGGEEMNQMVDEEAGEQEPVNAFDEFGKAGENDPIIKSSLDYISKVFSKDQ